MFLSIDGNFGLCRKKASGTSNHPPLHGQTMFLEQDEVNNYVANYAVTKASVSKVSFFTMFCWKILHFEMIY